MTQSSEDYVSQPADSPSTARVLPFDRQSELQRAVQRRAQERIEAEAIKPRIPLVRRLITLAVALIPVTLIFSGFLIAVQAVRIITALYTSPATHALQPPPAAVEAPSQPGLIILVPDKSVGPLSTDKPTSTKEKHP